MTKFSASTLEALASALERGRVPLPAPTIALEGILQSGEIEEARALLGSFLGEGFTPKQAAFALRMVSENQRKSESSRPQLVWSGLDVRGIRDTVVVVEELFRTATKSVVLSTYNLGHKPKAGEPPGNPVLRALGERMQQVPSLKVQLYVNIKRQEWQKEATASDVVAKFGKWFCANVWPWSRLPEVYFDPRSIDSEDSCLHAKCVVIDEHKVFLTSANLTESAQVSNIEAGALFDDPVFAIELRQQFDALRNRKMLQRVEFGD